MGYSMSVYRVDLDAMRTRIAQKDQALLDELTKKHAQDLQGQAEEIEETDFEAPEELKGCLGFLVKKASPAAATQKPTHPQPTEEPTPELLLKHLVFGLPKFHGGYSMYGYQFRWLVSHLGTELDAGAFESMRSSSGWTETVGKALVGAGMPKTTFEFDKTMTGRGAPIPMPPMVDFPYIGYLEAAEVKSVLEALKGVDTAKFVELTGEPEYGQKAINNLQGWLTEAAAANQGIVAFYS